MARPTTQRTYKVAGVSFHTKTMDYKVRFFNDLIFGIKKRQREGDTNIELLELPQSMTKHEIIKHLKTTDLYNDPRFIDCINEADEKYNGVPTIKVRRVRQNSSGIKSAVY